MVQCTKEHNMTNSQRNFLLSLVENLRRAKSAGLVVSAQRITHSRFISLTVSIKFPKDIDGPRRYGHDQEFFGHVMVGKRGGLEGYARLGGLCAEGCSKGYQSKQAWHFDLYAQNGCKHAVDMMVDTAERMASLQKEVAA
jgi:hypothetical protein